MLNHHRRSVARRRRTTTGIHYGLRPRPAIKRQRTVVETITRLIERWWRHVLAKFVQK